MSYVFAVTRHDSHFYDAAWYELESDEVASGHGFTDPFVALREPDAPVEPSAQHPPLTVFVLAPVAWVTGESALAMRLAMAALGAITVGMLGILGREIANDTTGFVAAVIAALYPFLWVNDGLLMSETLCALTITLCIYFAYRFSNRPTLGRAAILGVLCGIAALARTELILLVPLFGIWFLVARNRVMRAVRWRAFGALVAGAALMTMPWVAYNLARFDEPTFLSTNDGVALLGSNCAAVYSGSAIGGTNLTPGVCLPRVPPRGDDSVEARVYREKALSYIGRHEVRFPVVLAARVGRTWGLFRPQDELPAGEGEGRARWITTLGLIWYYPLTLLALGGAVVLHRRGVALWPLMTGPVIVVVSAVVSFGKMRFRVPAEPALVLLAAVAVAVLCARVALGRRSHVCSSSSAKTPRASRHGLHRPPTENARCVDHKARLARGVFAIRQRFT